MGASFYTHGIKTQSYDLLALVEKYGEPTHQSSEVVQNRMGAKYDSITAVWSSPELTVVYSATWGDLDTGYVKVDMPAAAELRKAISAQMDKLMNPRKL